MIIQLINLSIPEVFKKYSNDYGIFRDVYSVGLFGLEIRNITSKLAGVVHSIVLNEKEICYKKNNEESIDLCITGSINFFKELSRKIVSSGNEDLGYRIVTVIKNIEEYGSLKYKLGSKVLSFKKHLIMGILNVTPDSFSDGGKYTDPVSAVNSALSMIEEGADIIDVGGESTRPGAEPVTPEEEIRRTIPVIQGIIKKKPDAVISIDTTKSEVVRKALENGAVIVNDISGLSFDNSIAPLVKKYDACIVLMHMKGTPKTMQDSPSYTDVVSEVYDFLYEQSNFAIRKGIKKIIVDPGIGFGKRVEDNFEIIKRLKDFQSLGFPILVGLSRKSFIGKTLDLEVDQRDIPTAILESLSIMNSARIIRTHNVKLAAQSRKIIQQLYQA